MAWINIAVLLPNDIVNSHYLFLLIYLYQLIQTRRIILRVRPSECVARWPKRPPFKTP
jgi:hypothetical protein